MNKPRLEKLILALEGVPIKHFNMDKYGTCGTPACVLGHFAARTDLQRKFVLKHEFHTQLFAIDGHEVDYWDGEVREYFGINAEQAEALFGPEGCDRAQTPAKARRYIRKFIDSNGKL